MAVDETRDNNLRSWIRQGLSLATFLLARDTATAAAASAAASAVEAQNAAANAVAGSDNSLGTDALARVFCPAGVTPNRPSTRPDVSYVFFSPSPPSTAAGKMMPGVDFWCVMDI